MNFNLVKSRLVGGWVGKDETIYYISQCSLKTRNISRLASLGGLGGGSSTSILGGGGLPDFSILGGVFG